MKSRGRPQANIRLDPEQIAEIKRRARKLKVTLSEWIRLLIEREIGPPAE